MIVTANLEMVLSSPNGPRVATRTFTLSNSRKGANGDDLVPLATSTTTASYPASTLVNIRPAPATLTPTISPAASGGASNTAIAAAAAGGVVALVVGGLIFGVMVYRKRKLVHKNRRQISSSMLQIEQRAPQPKEAT